MKRFFILSLLSTIAFSWPVQKVEAVNLESEMFMSPPCNIPPALVSVILKRAAAELGTDYFSLAQEHLDGLCTIEAITPKSYKVSDGAGSIIILEMDDLL